jgi:hypothetical protein
MSNSADITIIIPCHTNDSRVERALASAQWAKEVFVLDQNSQQDWSHLSKIFNFTKFSQDVVADFSKMRNSIMEKVKTKWIFFLDSDEFIPKVLATEIQNAIEKDTYSAFRIKRQDFILSKNVFHGEVGNKSFLRVVKSGVGKWEGKVHEELIVKAENEIGKLENPIIHESHLSTHDFISKINLYTSLLADDKNESQTKIKSVLFPIGKFIYTYFFKMGFLDGFRGLIYCFCMSIHSSVVRIKRYEKNK